MSDLVSEDIDGSEASRGVGTAHHVRGAELGDHTGMRGQAHPAHRR